MPLPTGEGADSHGVPEQPVLAFCTRILQSTPVLSTHALSIRPVCKDILNGDLICRLPGMPGCGEDALESVYYTQRRHLLGVCVESHKEGDPGQGGDRGQAAVNA